MKKSIKTLGLSAAMLALVLTSCADDKIVTENDLPEEISTYISNNFPDNEVAQVTVDQEAFSKKYAVILKDNIKLEFDSKNNITDIDANAALPDNVIPAEILAYVNANYPNNVITDWELEDKHQQVKLDNGLTLEFSLAGEFLRIDD